MVFREITAAYCENHGKHIHAFCGKTAEVVNINTPNICQIYQNVTDQIIMILYFHSINVLFDVFPQYKNQVGSD
jgi:hypothetical protein